MRRFRLGSLFFSLVVGTAIVSTACTPNQAPQAPQAQATGSGQTQSSSQNQSLNQSQTLPQTLVGAGKYAEFIAHLDLQISSLDKLVADLSKAQTAAAVAKALDAYTVLAQEEMRVFAQIQARIPDAGQDPNPPAELDRAFARMQDASLRVQAAMMRLAPLLEDPLVEAANQRLQSVILP